MEIMGTVCMYKSVMCCAATPFGGGQTYVSDEFQEITYKDCDISRRRVLKP